MISYLSVVYLLPFGSVVSLSDNIVGCIIELTLYRVGLVLGFFVTSSWFLIKSARPTATKTKTVGILP